MKRYLRFLLVLFAVLSSAYCCADFFCVPSSIQTIASEALSDISNDCVFIPSTVYSIAPDAFSDSVKTIYGVSSTAAERFANATGREFVPVDISGLHLTSNYPLFIDANHAFLLEATADCTFGSLEFSYQLFSEDKMIAQADHVVGPVEFSLEREGKYDLIVIADSGFDYKLLCLDNAIEIVPPIQFSQEEFYIDVGETTSVPAQNEDRAITLSEQGNGIYSVSGTEITGCKEGTAQLAAEFTYVNGWTMTGTVTVHVVKPVSSVSIVSEVYEFYPGESLRLSAFIEPDNAVNNDIFWSSSNENTFMIDEYGLLTAVAPGIASIRATSHSGIYSEITVVCIKQVEEIILDGPLFVEVCAQLPLHVRFLPDDTYDNTLSWRSENENIAIVENGVLTGLKPGECLLTATARNGVSSVVRVFVLQPVTEVRLNVSSFTTEIFTPVTLSAAILPESAYDPTILWSSSDDSIATVDASGTVYGLRGGQVLITAAASSGAFAVCEVTISEIKPTSISFNRSFYCLQVGCEQPACVDLKPYEAQNQNLIFLSSDPDVFTVDAKGMIYGVKKGRATLTCISQSNPDVYDSCTVNVILENTLPLEGITIGINPGHQSKAIMKTYPVSPGSSVMKPGCKAGAQGINSKRPEYEVNLDVSLKLQQLLIEGGADVVMTRTTNDAYLTNIERAQILNDANVDMAIQVHCDGSDSASPHGMSAYYRSTGPYTTESKLFADMLLTTMVSETGASNHGLHINNEYMSLNYSTTPAVLVELGYLSNPTEDRLLNSEGYQLQLAQAMYDAICLYFAR